MVKRRHLVILFRLLAKYNLTPFFFWHLTAFFCTIKISNNGHIIDIICLFDCFSKIINPLPMHIL